MSDRNAEQAMQDGPNTHHFRTYRGTSYSVVRVEDVDGVTHGFHVPHEVKAAIRVDLQEELSELRLIAALKQAPVEGGHEISTVVVRSALMDMLKEGRGAKSELDALKAESQHLAAENARYKAARVHLAEVCVCQCVVPPVGHGRHQPECTLWIVDEFDCVLSPPPEPSEWLRRAAAAEDSACVSVGGLVTRLAEQERKDDPSEERAK